jgi:hypothetical protein
VGGSCVDDDAGVAALNVGVRTCAEAYATLLAVQSASGDPCGSAFTVTGSGVEHGDSSSGVLVADDQCVTDGAGHYGSNEAATITAVFGGPIYSKAPFNTEQNYDTLRIKGNPYSGTTGIPTGLVLNSGETFTWNSDATATSGLP